MKSKIAIGLLVLAAAWLTDGCAMVAKTLIMHEAKKAVVNTVRGNPSSQVDVESQNERVGSAPDDEESG